MKYEDYTNNEYMPMEGEELEPCEDCMEAGATGPRTRRIEVEEVLGMGSAETIVEVCIPLCPPAFEVMENLITKVVEFDAVVASKGKVFINGRIIKDIPYKTRVRVCNPSCDAVSKITFGNVRHATAEIPFALCIDVPEAFKGAKVVVLNTDINSVEIPNHTQCIPDKCVPRCEPEFLKDDNCQRKLFKSLTEKDCISVTVKVVRDVIINVPGTMGPTSQY